MKKGKAIGIGVAVLAVVIVLGIASLPDEVLLENPIETSDNIPPVNIPTEILVEVPETPEEVPETPEEVPETPETVPETPVEEPETIPETEPEAPEEETEGNVIEVKISDGIGSQEK